jgi:hypothetical protein
MTEPALGCYVYCIVPAGSYPALEEAKGVDPDFGLTMVTQRDLSAVASPVRLEQFGADALRRNLEQLPWVERTARAHDSVLARALTADAVIPLRLCTIFTDEAHVREMLERERDLLTSELDRLRGHAEWSVKLLAERAKLEAAARERIPALAGAGAGAGEEAAPGRAFFERKKVDRTVSDEARAIAGAAADEVHTRLREVAAAATLLRPRHPDLSRRPGQMVLNAAYLVHGSHAGEFSAVAEELGRRHRGTGLELDFTGPWAPYNFVTPPEGQRDER